MRKLIKLKMMLFFLVLSAMLQFGGIQVKAEGERVYFGSEGYQWSLDEECPIGIYAGAANNIYSADLYVEYDAEMLEHSSGGELVEPGLVHIYASEIGSAEYMYMLGFVPRVAGDTQITIRQTPIVNENGETVEAAAVSVGINIPMAEGCALNGIQVNGKSLEGFNPSVTRYSVDVDADTALAEIVLDPAEIQAEISDTNLVTGANEIRITTMNEAGYRARYVLTVNRLKTKAESEVIPEPEQDKTEKAEPTALVEKEETLDISFETILTGVVVVLVLLLFSLIMISVKMWKKKREKQKAYQNSLRAKRAGKSGSEDGNGSLKQTILNDTGTSVLEDDSDDYYEGDNGKELEIAVRNVTMEFKREKDEATSIKELLIRTLKGQRSYEMFRALDNISFNIWEGEVVGIIGTNGSGKSTILKIISGALAPTSGYVEVDKNKIQLLTLGTGFDYELTGKENVYLNGAIIGYTKEYIDEKYDDIVKFAELEGFMEEKVRNYSSGMVSRLGFAIATVRDTPEILILDEVLSVGDMFFRKKSEARIKEMMHGGSTVLIVSHSTSVIRNNCTKAIWIEKGVMRAMGDPKEVCAAYEKMNEAG